MKPTHITAAAALLGIALSLAGCGLEGKQPHIYLENKSDQPIVLQQPAESGTITVTAPPHVTRQTLASPPYGHCWDNWQIVDENGKLLREIHRVCADDHITYP